MTPLPNDRKALAGLRTHSGSAVAEFLVSVRDRQELVAAARCGVDIVDLKEPRRGALAPSDEALWVEAASIWLRAEPRMSTLGLSAALGEQPDARRVAARVPAEFSFAKVGPSGCGEPAQLSRLWCEIRQRLDPRVELVAVAYADHRNADTLPAETIFRSAADAGFKRCLIDTFEKDGRSTLDHLGFDGLRRLRNVAVSQGLWWTLAGSIGLDCVSQLQRRGCLPDCFGVRGDVCQRGRESSLSTVRIASWKSALSMAGTGRSDALMG